MAQDLSQNATAIIEMISEDRRSLRFKRQIDIREFDFDEEIVLRLFRSDDVVQITFSDELEEFFVSLHCAELPLSLDQKTIWFAQVKTKQVRVDLQLEQNESLIPEPEQEEVKETGAAKAAPLSMLDNLVGNLKLDVLKQAEKSKDQIEF